MTGDRVADPVDVHAQLPSAVVRDAEGYVWQFRSRVYGASWYRVGDSQPHPGRDIPLPATLLTQGHRDDEEVEL